MTLQTNERPRGQAEAFQEADGPTSMLHEPELLRKILNDFISGLSNRLPPVLADCWRDGYYAGNAHEAGLQERIRQLEREADDYWFQWKNPGALRDETHRALQIMADADGFARDAWRMDALGALASRDRDGYRRVLRLGLTDRRAADALLHDLDRLWTAGAAS